MRWLRSENATICAEQIINLGWFFFDFFKRSIKPAYTRKEHTEDGHEGDGGVSVLAVSAVAAVQVVPGQVGQLVPRGVRQAPEGSVDDLVGAVDGAVAGDCLVVGEMHFNVLKNKHKISISSNF